MSTDHLINYSADGLSFERFEKVFEMIKIMKGLSNETYNKIHDLN